MSRAEPPPGTTSATELVVCSVSHADAPELDGFVAALERSDVRCPLVLVDCASRDGSAERARELARRHPWIEPVALRENLGFAGGMNQAIRHARRFAPQWIWSLNPDTRPAPEAARTLLDATSARPIDGAVGAVTPRLHRIDGELADGRLDACGMRLTRSWRHLDRGSEEPDDGRYGLREEVFGGTGAATLYRLDALDDVRFPGGDLFDSLFHSYREDAELAFRLQRRRWRTVYEPAARVGHRRRVTPARRRDLPAAINRAALRNRYLLRIYHQSLGNALGPGALAWARDLGVLVYVLTRERSSLGAYVWLWQHRAQLRARRRWLAEHTPGGLRQIAPWFARQRRPLAA